MKAFSQGGNGRCFVQSTVKIMLLSPGIGFLFLMCSRLENSILLPSYFSLQITKVHRYVSNNPKDKS